MGMRIDPYARAEGYPVPDQAAIYQANRASQPEEKGALAKAWDALTSGISSLYGSNFMGGVRERPLEQRLGTGQFRSGGDTHTMTPEQWTTRFSQQPGAMVDVESNLGDVTGDTDLGVGAGLGGRPKKRKPNEEAVNLAKAGTVPEDQATKELKALIKRIEGKKDFDLTPLLALTDTWTGSNFTRSYDRPLNEDERDKVVASLKARVAEHEQSAVAKRDYLAQLHQEKIDAAELRREGYDNALKIAGIQVGARITTAGMKMTGTEGKTEDKLYNKFRPALEQLAIIQHGNPADPYDATNKSAGKLYAPEIHRQVKSKGKALEDAGAAPKGEGYETALQWYTTELTKPKVENAQ
jgi:hypothetical protein